MKIQNSPSQNSFNGKLIIARTPEQIAKAKDILVSGRGKYIQTSPREIVNLDNGTRLNTITKMKLPPNDVIKYFTNSDGDVYKTFNSPIQTSQSNDLSVRMIADQIAQRINITLKQDSKINDVIKILKGNGMIQRISIDNIKAARLVNKIEDITGEKIELKPNQPKYFINCNNKLFFIADCAKCAES